MRLLFILGWVVVSTALLLADYSYAQSARASRTNLFVSGGMGFSAAGTKGRSHERTSGGIAGRLAVSLEYKRALLLLRRTASTGGHRRFQTPFIPTQISDRWQEAGVLVGYRVPLTRTLEIYGATGIASVWGTRSVDQFDTFADSRISVSRVFGIPLESGVWLNVEGGLSVGLVGYGNVNHEQAFAGLTANIAYRLGL